jgi:serine/threonine protein kinase
MERSTVYTASFYIEYMRANGAISEGLFRDFLTVDRLGAGGQAIVHKAYAFPETHKQTNKFRYAIKAISKLSPQLNLKSTEYEMKNLMSLERAKEFSSLYRIYDEEDKIFLVIDYVKGKTL